MTMIDPDKIGVCAECIHRFPVKRKFGTTFHCLIEITKMDVTHVEGKCEICPMLRSEKNNE